MERLYRYSSKFAVGIGLILTIIAGVILTLGNKDLANGLATFVFYLLILGVVLIIIENLYELRRKHRIEEKESE